MSDALPDIVGLQNGVSLRPYSISARLDLARAYKENEYPDLAAGEAYIALLLVDESLGHSGEFEDEAVEAAIADFGPGLGFAGDSDPDAENEYIRKRVVEVVGNDVRNGIYMMLIENLTACGNLKQADDYLQTLRKSFDTTNNTIQELESIIKDALPGDRGKVPIEDYPEWGQIRREVYPWNTHEPDRSTPESLVELNDQLTDVAPKLKARIVELPDLINADGGVVKQIGLFADQDLEPGEKVLKEKSVLTATSRINDTFCDACAAKLPVVTLGAVSMTESGEVEGPVSCPECAETIFCSQTCLDQATELYHPALCDAPLGSLAKDADAKDASHSLYALLLMRTFALASHQDAHPLSLPETRYLWGDFTPFALKSKTLPFNLYFNVVLPLTMLEKMDINPFTSTTSEGGFPPWVFNTLYAKFRGTADAKQGPDGKPEVGAVHPLWCLANHSCAPNVRWEWEGPITFSVRTEEQSVKWREGEGMGMGIKKDEEIRGHYCDLELPVRERREWARGALGGDCMCERCVWEDANPNEARDVRIAR